LKATKVLSMAMTAALALGAFAGASGGVASAKSVQAQSQDQSPKVQSKSVGGPVDLAIANEDRLIKMLIKEGTISKNASASEAQKAVQKYITKKQASLESQQESKGQLDKKEEKEKKKTFDKLKKGNKDQGKDKFGSKVNNVKEENYKGEMNADKVLTLLIEFPDALHNGIKPEESDMYYSDYTKDHYRDMIFGTKGYAGPNGEKLVSVKQYYEQQSGESYTVNGDVAGWYMAAHPAAYYGGNDPAPDGSDRNARGLVREALADAAKDPNINLGDYDEEDRYDLDGDGNYNEPDGLVDHLMVVHSSVGEEAGGGALGGDAIWSHRWNLGNVYAIPGTTTDNQNWGGKLAAYDYTIEPADGAAGVFAHEYGHDLGLPDEYDTQYSGTGEAVGYWSIMASGSWSGTVPGTEPSGFSAWSKEYLQAAHGGNWQKAEEINIDEIGKKGFNALLDQANTKGTNLDSLRVNLPDKQKEINKPFAGSKEYFSGSADGLNNSLTFDADLTKGSQASLNFKAWYEIEQDYDYAYLQVREKGTTSWNNVEGNLTTTDNPEGSNLGNGITGHSNGWVDASFDLSAYAGKNVEVRIAYISDGGVSEAGLYVDELALQVDGQNVFTDGAESTPKVTLNGFSVTTGISTTQHYYLLEWRNHQGVDQGLDHLKRGDSLMSYDPGLVVWYVDNSFTENWTGKHPGDGFLGVVDADQTPVKWSDGSFASTRYQIHDAAFSLRKSENMFLDYSKLLGITMEDKHTELNSIFDDSRSYLNASVSDSGRNVPQYGLKIMVTGESKDRSVGQVRLFR
jgi:immune inhibitor A